MKLKNTTPRVLAIDDDFSSLILYQESLQPAGFIVDEADSGSAAIQQFKKQRPDIILLDVVMPNMTGYRTCKEIRKLPGGADVPIIMVTGLDDLDSISDAYEAGATDFITKPLNWPILRHRLFYILRASNAIVALRRNERLLTIAQRIAQLGSWEWTPNTNELSYSEEFSRIFCLKKIEGAGLRDMVRAIHPADRRLVQQAFKHLDEKNRKSSIEHRINMPDKSLRYVNLQIELLNNDVSTNFTGTVQDITKSKKTEDQIRKLAYYDPLTGLPNRRLFRAQLERALNLASREASTIGLLFIDIDQFKQINDTLGHDAGDQLLIQFAERLKTSTRKSDYPSRNSRHDNFTAEMSRLGGDEFTVMLSNLKSVHGAAQVAQRLIDSMNQPFNINGSEVYSSVSIGVSLFPNDGDNMEALIKSSDIAMYHAKSEGRNNFQLYDVEMNIRVENRRNIENKIQKALDNRQFEVYYQPRINTKTGGISGMEALLRWPQSDGSVIMPNDFIPIAEESKLILPLGSWVIKDVIRQIKAWIDLGINDIPVAVNVSGHQLIHSKLEYFIPEEIAKTGIPAKLLELELTESILIKEPEKVSRTLKVLHDLGIRIAVDDFGTGYSSMATLKNFSLDILKIDRSFITDLPNEKDSTIIKAIISMAQGLNMDVIAEGIETETQMNFYREQNCSQVQGFLFSPAITAAEMTKKLLAQKQNLD